MELHAKITLACRVENVWITTMYTSVIVVRLHFMATSVTKVSCMLV